MTEAEFLAALPATLGGGLLILCRVGAAIMMLPGIGESEIPPMPRLALAVGLSLLIAPALLDTLPPPPASPVALAATIISEIAVGLWLGWLARLPALALPIAGQIISYLLGLSSVLIPDPTLGGQSTALARLFGLAAPVLVMATGLHRLAIAAIAGSYRVIPPGAILAAGDAATGVVAAMGACMTLALRLCAPFVIAGLAWQVATGLAARLVPRLQIYIVALPGQVLGGLLLLAATIGALVGTWAESARDATRALPGL